MPEPQEGEGEGGNEASAVSSEEDEHAAVVPHYKIHPTPAFPIFIKSPVVEVEVSEEGAGKEEGASSEEPVAEDEEVSKPQQGTLVGIGQVSRRFLSVHWILVGMFEKGPLMMSTRQKGFCV